MRIESASRTGQVASYLFLSSIVPRGFPAWNDSLKKQRVGLFDVRDEIDILHHCHSKHLLVRIPSRIWVYENIKEPTRFDCQNNLFERDTPRLLQLLILLLAPAICSHVAMITQHVPFVITSSSLPFLASPNHTNEIVIRKTYSARKFQLGNRSGNVKPGTRNQKPRATRNERRGPGQELDWQGQTT